ncbi:MAG: hypothetical protein FWD88_01885, partial [Treponema sp.]|nr:hypothetical protein [Treponema sp.]
MWKNGGRHRKTPHLQQAYEIPPKVSSRRPQKRFRRRGGHLPGCGRLLYTSLFDAPHGFDSKQKGDERAHKGQIAKTGHFITLPELSLTRGQKSSKVEA